MIYLAPLLRTFAGTRRRRRRLRFRASAVPGSILLHDIGSKAPRLLRLPLKNFVAPRCSRAALCTSGEAGSGKGECRSAAATPEPADYLLIEGTARRAKGIVVEMSLRGSSHFMVAIT